MFLLRRAFTLQNVVGRRARSQFIGSVVSGPPRVRISQQEKVGLTILLFGWWFPYPIWVCWHLDYYRDPHKERPPKPGPICPD